MNTKGNILNTIKEGAVFVGCLKTWEILGDNDTAAGPHCGNPIETVP